MIIIPVMDILGGAVVHGKGGDRSNYKPIKSVITDSSNPEEVAFDFKRKFGFKLFYLADLDAIEGRGNNYDILRKLSAQGFSLWVDAGVGKFKEAEKIFSLGVEKLIVGTETLTDVEELKLMLNKYGSNIIVSIDIKGGKLLTKCETLKGYTLHELILYFTELGCRNFILLNISAVGAEKGIEMNLNTSDRLAEVDVYYGGGIRSLEDIRTLKELNYKGALVATALHYGKITSEDIKYL